MQAEFPQSPGGFVFEGELARNGCAQMQVVPKRCDTQVKLCADEAQTELISVRAQACKIYACMSSKLRATPRSESTKLRA